MPLVRKRRATRDDIDDDDVQTPRRRQLPDDSSDEDVTMVADDDASQPGGAADVTQMARKLVRLALACEYSRQPIRRAEISAKVLGNHPRQFKTVFEEAQGTLRDVFGMEMSELPVREKITLQEKRAAQRAPKGSLSSKSWVLTTVLPPRFRDPAIIPPPAVPTHDAESAYIGLYTFLISVIYLNGGSLAEAKLERYLRRANADEYTPVDRTDKLLQRMQREGYLVRVKDNSTGEEMVEYMVGPRGKVEVGEKGVQGVVKKVYGEGASEDLDRRLERSLGVVDRMGGGVEEVREDGGNEQRRGPGRPRRRNEDDVEE